MGLNPGEKVYDDLNLMDAAPPSQSGYKPRDYTAEPYGSLPFAAAFPAELEIDRSNWSAAIRQATEAKAMLSQFWISQGLHALHQQQTSMCWCFAVVSAMLAWRAKMGLPYAKLSPASAAAPCENFRDNGGWSTNAVRWIAEHGISIEELWGSSQTKNDRRLWTPEVQADALTRRITEWFDVRPRNLRQQISCGILGLPVAVGYNRLGHAICQLDALEIEPGSFGIRLIDNYGESNGWCDRNGMYVMRENVAAADDAIAPRAITPTAK